MSARTALLDPPDVQRGRAGVYLSCPPHHAGQRSRIARLTSSTALRGRFRFAVGSLLWHRAPRAGPPSAGQRFGSLGFFEAGVRHARRQRNRLAGLLLRHAVRRFLSFS